MSGSSSGAVLGLVFGLSVLLLVSRLHATRRPRLSERVLPFVAGGSRPRSAAPAPTATLVALLQPSAGLGSDRSVARTLMKAGRIGDLDRFRIEQVAGGLIGAVVGGFLGLIAVVRGGPFVAVVLLGGFGVVLGMLFVDRMLASRARQRSSRMGRELPAIAELLAFAVAAGESPMAALERVATMTSGDLSAECRTAVGDLRAGMPIDAALRGIADRSGNPDVERFVDGITVAIERGTPLADVLRAQAADARAADRRALLESAGRKDVLMLVPVVFFILPTVVGIALFPGMQSLQLVVP